MTRAAGCVGAPDFCGMEYTSEINNWLLGQVSRGVVWWVGIHVKLVCLGRGHAVIAGAGCKTDPADVPA